MTNHSTRLLLKVSTFCHKATGMGMYLEGGQRRNETTHHDHHRDERRKKERKETKQNDSCDNYKCVCMQ